MTGMRLEEMGSRLVDDIKERDGIAFIEVHGRGEGQSVKTEGSRREVPIHSELVRLGFLHYVKHVRAGRHQRLFPDLRRAGSAVQKGKATKTFSHWWGRWMESELKITDPGLVFHSFRHAFKRFARDAEINTEIHDLLTGHSSGTVGSTYGKGASIKTLKAAIEKIRFAELMPALPPWGSARGRSRGHEAPPLAVDLVAQRVTVSDAGATSEPFQTAA